MTKEQAVQLLRSLINVPAIKLLLASPDIAAAEEALKVLAEPPPATNS